MSYQPKILVFAMRTSDDGRAYKGYVTEIDNTLEAKQKFVGGTIQVVRLNSEIDLVCNDDGKIICLPPNRVWLDDDGKPLDVLVGNVLCCRHDNEGNFVSIKYSDIPFILSCLVGVNPYGDKLRGIPEFDLDIYQDLDELRRVYTEGRKLRLLKDIDDEYSGKKAGDVFTVSSVDDACNIHGSWQSGGSIAIIYGVDEFEIIE